MMDEKKYWKYMKALIVCVVFWTIAAAVNLLNGIIYIVLFAILFLQAFDGILQWSASGKGMLITRKMKNKSRSRIIGIMYLGYGLIELFLVLAPWWNILPPVMWPFTYLDILYYGLEALVIIGSIELGIYGMVKYLNPGTQVEPHEIINEENPAPSEDISEN